MISMLPATAAGMSRRHPGRSFRPSAPWPTRSAGRLPARSRRGAASRGCPRRRANGKAGRCRGSRRRRRGADGHAEPGEALNDALDRQRATIARRGRRRSRLRVAGSSPAASGAALHWLRPTSSIWKPSASAIRRSAAPAPCLDAARRCSELLRRRRPIRSAESRRRRHARGTLRAPPRSARGISIARGIAVDAREGTEAGQHDGSTRCSQSTLDQCCLKPGCRARVMISSTASVGSRRPSRTSVSRLGSRAATRGSNRRSP